MDWTPHMDNNQIWTVVIGVFFALSELMGMAKRGPNGILHALWRFYNLKVEVEYDDNYLDGDIDRYEETLISNRETVVLESSKATSEQISPNVWLIGDLNKSGK